MRSARNPSADITPIAAPEPATLADQAYRQLKQLIFDFALMPGDQIGRAHV